MLISRSKFIQKTLNQYYPEPPVPLNSLNNFTFLVAVVLSAQTTDGKVNNVTDILFKLASSPSDMMKLDVTEIESIIASVGLAPTKAKNISKLSKMIQENFHGLVPNNYEDLESLPGVGHKTASVVMGQCFGESAFAVDTHVHRLALRWKLTNETRNVDKVQKDICKIFPKEDWNKLHLQMIYFGREYCPAKNHKNSECPICSSINNPSELPDENNEKNPFKSHKPGKGIILYSDRIRELALNSTLSFNSPSPQSSNAQKITPVRFKIENLLLEEIEAEAECKGNHESVIKNNLLVHSSLTPQINANNDDDDDDVRHLIPDSHHDTPKVNDVNHTVQDLEINKKNKPRKRRVHVATVDAVSNLRKRSK